MSPPTKASSAPPTNFLTLPPELRNEIYSYALTTPNATLEYKNNDDSGHKQLNQLQYVCKQLYCECHQLELKFNQIITFSSRLDAGTSAIEQFLAFLAHVAPEKQDWLRTIVLYSALPNYWRTKDDNNRRYVRVVDRKHHLFQLADKCRIMPHMKVKYMLPELGAVSLGADTAYPYAAGAILWGAIFSAYFRFDTLHDLWPRVDSVRTELPPWRGIRNAIMKHVRPWDGHTFLNEETRRDVANLQADNLRFYPTEDILEGDAFETGRWFRDDAMTQDLMPVWEATMRRWAAEGF